MPTTNAPSNPWMNLNNLVNGPYAQPDQTYSDYYGWLKQNDPSGNTGSDNMSMEGFQQPSPAPSEAPSSIDFLKGMLPENPQGYSGGAPIDMSAMNKLLAQMDAKKTQGYQEEQDALSRLKEYRDKIPQAATGVEGMNLAPLVALAQSWGGGNDLLRGYTAPKTQAQLNAETAKLNEQIGELGGRLSAQDMGALKDRLTGEIAKVHYGVAGKAGADQKTQGTDDRAAQKFESDIRAEKASSKSPLGQAANRVYAADRAQGIVAQYPDPNDIPLKGAASISELAIALNSLLAPGNPNVTMYEDIVPQSARGSAATIKSYLTNKVKGAEMGDFVKNMQHTIEREKAISQGQLQNAIQSAAKANTKMGWVKRNPDLFKSIVQHHLESGIVGAPPSLESGHEDGGYRFKGGNPADPNNWEKL